MTIQANKSFLLAGAVRNCGKTLRNDVKRLQSAMNAVGTLHWLIVESDSGDDTVSVLHALRSEITNFKAVSLGKLRTHIPQRTARIAHCRNVYLDLIAGDPDYQNLDYLVVADLDGINDMISENAFLSCFERDDWDVCTANQRGPYYDILALRHPVWSPSDCLAQFRLLMRGGLSEGKALFAAVYSKMIRIDESSDWMPVTSAFGGLAIYRRSVLGSARYSGLDATGTETCEHVLFHEALGARIFVNPRLINAGYTEHSQPLRFLPGLKLRAKLLVKSAIRTLFGDSALMR
jgi:glycosyltransferase involved in cell wall biosynthesis